LYKVLYNIVCDETVSVFQTYHSAGIQFN